MAWTQAAFGRIALGLTALGLVVLLTLGAGLVWLVQETRSYATAALATQQIRVATADVLSSLQDAESSQRGYLLTGNPGYLAPFHAAEAQLPAELDTLAAQVAADGGPLAAQVQLRAAIDAKLADLRTNTALTESGDRQAAIESVRSGRGRALMEQVQALVSGVEQRTIARQQQRSARLEGAGQLLMFGTITGLLLVALVSFGTLRAARSYTRDLEAARAALAQANASLGERVAARTESLMAANEEIQRFAYIVSHDLRAPLVNVMGFTQELETAILAVRGMMARAETVAPGLLTQDVRDAVEEDIPEAIGFIRSSSNRMDRLIGAILALSREGRRRLVAEPVPLHPLLEGLSNSLHHQIDTAGADLRLQSPFPTLQTDRLALEQILGNLLDNAIKYLDPTRPGRILVRARREAGMHALDVVDNGRGIAARDHIRVFELFRRSGPQDQPGEGIGLAHVRALARRMGGDIRLASQLGEGSVFTLLLPDVLPAPDTAIAPQLEDQPV